MDRPYPQTTLEALLVEREGYVARNLKSRVAEVDEQIKLIGGVVVDERPDTYPEGGSQKLILSYVGDDKERAAEALAAEQAKGDDASEKFVAKLEKLANPEAD